MKLVSLKLWRHRGDQNCVELADQENLSFISFFQRPVCREQLRFHSRVVGSRTKIGERQSIQLEELGYCHCYVHPSGLVCTVVSDKEYPLRVAYTLIQEALKIFLDRFPPNSGNCPWQLIEEDNINFIGSEQVAPMIQELFEKFQDPETADKIFRIEKELDELKSIMMKNMDDLMQRGETLQNLEDKSSDLSNMGKKFAREARKNNECCNTG